MKELANGGIALGAATSPAWLPALQTASVVAGILLPILGAVWLSVQIYIKIAEFRRKRKLEANNDSNQRSS